ncbi:hypothetical protein FO519_007522 [Halicephalobus sp. NKZ332]|nr:hypothetical protein FO519_007522 [Halicephalobus sp. NKZ332]
MDLTLFTESDLLNVQRPVRRPVQQCVRQIFPHRTPDKSCTLNKHVPAIIEPAFSRKFKKVVVIRSAPTASDYRNFIRQTWKKSLEDSNIPVVFVSGKGKKGTDLESEAKEFNDILELDFVDSYKNLTLKMMATYSYFLRYPSVDQIVVINDDTIVNKTALLRDTEETGNHESYIIGKVSRGYPRLIFPWLMWHVPGSMYPHMCYPPFVQGSSFIISREAAETLVKNICEFPFVHLDDIMMGIVAHCLNLKLLHREGFDKHILDRFTVYHYQYSRHSAKDLASMWNSLNLEF